MHAHTIEALLSLNRQFYQTFALQFSTSRQRLQPGVQRLLPELLGAPRILDLGCGNGVLALRLLQEGFQGAYTGLDFSHGLLEIAQERLYESRLLRSEGFSFQQAELAVSGWCRQLPYPSYTHVLAFAVLHHLPGAARRLGLLHEIRSLLVATGRGAPEGKFIHSEWQFMNSPRLRARIQSWDAVHLSPQDVEPGDYLLDWRQGGSGLRYVHHFTPAELDELASAAGFSILNSFSSDGEAGRLGLYQVWVPAEPLSTG
ncbi:MAG: class I SAM-dependent methyltransferase [Anaerolineales bacterium]|nr:class I SAM-dependent methyltransferase [Anaerolineales bacterium]